MTPISFALEILLDCETIEKAHKACRKYIKQLESQSSQNTSVRASSVQAPSTQRLLEAQLQPTAPITPPPTIHRIQGGEVQTSATSKGPRKW